MKRTISMISALLVLAMLIVPACCAAAASDADAQSVPELDRNFNVDLATTLIIIICSVVTVLLLLACVILAKRNIRN